MSILPVTTGAIDRIIVNGIHYVSAINVYQYWKLVHTAVLTLTDPQRRVLTL